MATVFDALEIARTLINDDGQVMWSDALLMPKVRQAHQELVAKLALNGVATTREETAVLTVMAGVLSLGLDQPTDLLQPIKMDEAQVGALLSDFVPMTKAEFTPDLDKTETLRYWCWREGVIQFLGATTDRQVHLYYIKGFPAPTAVTDQLFIPQEEIFIGPRVSALVRLSQDHPTYQAVNQIADNNLSLVVRAYIKADQALPARRRPFSYAIRQRRGVWI